MNVDKLLLAAVVFLTACRLVVIGQSEITPEEALLWMQSGRLAMGYVENGPVAAGLICLSTQWFGDTAFGLRFWNPLLTALSTYLIYLLSRSLTNQMVARWMVVLFSVTPAANLATVAHLPDNAGLTFALLAIWLCWCALHRAHPWHGLWPAAGATLGVAVITRPPLFSLALAVGLIPSCIPRWRGLWYRPGFYLLFAACAAVVLFVFTHSTASWMSVNLYALRWNRWLRTFGWHGEDLGLWLLGLFVLTGPLVIPGVVWMLRQRGARPPYDGCHAFSILFAAIPLVWGLLLAAFFGGTPCVLWLGVVPVTVLLVERWWQSNLPVLLKTRWRSAALGVSALLTLALTQPEWLRTFGIPWPYGNALEPPMGWRESAGNLDAALRQAAGRGAGTGPLFVIADSPSTAALLDFYLPDDAPVLRMSEAGPRIHAIESQGIESSFSLWPNYSARLTEPHTNRGRSNTDDLFRGRTALYLTRSPQATPPPNIVHAFRSVEPAAILLTKRRGQPLLQWSYFNCYGYAGLPL